MGFNQNYKQFKKSFGKNLHRLGTSQLTCIANHLSGFYKIQVFTERYFGIDCYITRTHENGSLTF